MKIGIVYELQEEPASWGEELVEESAEFAAVGEIETLTETLADLGHQPVKIGDFRQLVQFLHTRGQVDLILNYAAGITGQAREAQVPAFLDAMGLPYTGADPLSLAVCSDKAVTKGVWQSYGLPTAPFALVREISELGPALEALPGFPLFLKPAREGSSKGISPKSFVTSWAELYQRVETLLEQYHQPVLMEAYLPGREYTAGIMGSGANAQVMGVVEILHKSQAFVDLSEKKKWRTQVFRPVSEHCQENGRLKDSSLERDIARLCLEAYRAVDCQTIGRVDVRLDNQGQPNLIEINPNPGLHPVRSAMPAIASLAGISYRDLIGWLIELAEEKWQLSPQAARSLHGNNGHRTENLGTPGSHPAEALPSNGRSRLGSRCLPRGGPAFPPSGVLVKKTATRGLGVFADRDFKRGEFILSIWGPSIPEQNEHSIQVDWDCHVEPSGTARFLNHSCEPNVGVKTNRWGIPDFYAFRDIRKGDEVTFDYAMTEFTHYERSDPSLDFDLTCLCGSPNCRGRLGYFSELSDELVAKYAGFISDYLIDESRRNAWLTNLQLPAAQSF